MTTPRGRLNKRRPLSPNRAKVAELRAAHKSTREIACLLGITRQAVEELYKPLVPGPGPGRPRANEQGKTYVAVTVGTRVEVKAASVWNCTCKCGEKFRCNRQALVDGDVIDCGCGIGATL